MSRGMATGMKVTRPPRLGTAYTAVAFEAELGDLDDSYAQSGQLAYAVCPGQKQILLINQTSDSNIAQVRDVPTVSTPAKQTMPAETASETAP